MESNQPPTVDAANNCTAESTGEQNVGETTPSTEYDELCKKALAETEQRLIAHFNSGGGDVLVMGEQCEHCKATTDLKLCARCNIARFCGKDCMTTAWPKHKKACSCINNVLQPQQTSVKALLEILGWSESAKDVTRENSPASSVSVLGNAPGLTRFPGWMPTVDVRSAPAGTRKAMLEAALQLYGLVRDEDAWKRDDKSFPPSAYTCSQTAAHSAEESVRSAALKELFELRGERFLLLLWFQDPQPPTVVQLPLEDRPFLAVVDSLLQISAIRDGCDDFMDHKNSAEFKAEFAASCAAAV